MAAVAIKVTLIMPIDLTTYTGVDLVGDDNRNEFRGVMMDIKATFHRTPILYKLAGTTFSRFNEDRKSEDNTAYTDYNLMAFVEYSQLVEDKYEFTSEGADPDARVRVTFNTDYLDQEGLWDGTNNLPKMNGIKDKLFISGREYRITEIPVLDGMIEAKSIHVIIYASPIIADTE